MITKLVSNIHSSGKAMMIFSAICVVIGIIWYIFFDGIQHYVHTSTHPVVLEFLTETIGRIGMTAFFCGGGLLIFIRGLIAHRNRPTDEK